MLDLGSFIINKIHPSASNGSQKRRWVQTSMYVLNGPHLRIVLMGFYMGRR
jgi:hypothetical protein